MRRHLTLVTFLAALAACSSTTAADPAKPTDPPPASDVDAGPGDPVPDAPCAPPAITFKRSPVAIDPPRDHHFTTVHEVAGVPYLYVMGGEQDDFAIVHSDIQRARIGDDGSLGAFEAAGTIPNGIAGSGFAVVGDDVVLFGGIVGPQGIATNAIQSGRFGADGKITEWKTASSKLPQRVMHASAVVKDRDVYVFGGTTGSSASTISGKVTVNADGSLTPLVPLTPLSPPRSHQAAFVAQGGVYLLGGLDKSPQGNPPSRSDVIRATFQPDGTIAAWENVGKLASPLSISAAEPVGCSILLIGGLDDTNGGPYSDGVLRGSVLKDSTFRTEKALEARVSVARGHVHQTPVYKKFIYSVAGRGNDDKQLGTVDIGTIEHP
ncbi:MAG TPA: hypothetical protein VLT33_19180 [Labilithrix sp.]|nr:hypothetical protein [Labilithrix sp.]